MYAMHRLDLLRQLHTCIMIDRRRRVFRFLTRGERRAHILLESWGSLRTLLVTSASLVVTGALLLVTMFAIRNKKLYRIQLELELS